MVHYNKLHDVSDVFTVGWNFSVSVGFEQDTDTEHFIMAQLLHIICYYWMHAKIVFSYFCEVILYCDAYSLNTEIIVLSTVLQT